MKKDFNIAIEVAGKVVDCWLPMKIQYDHAPGTVVCIAVNGVPKYINAFGFSDLEHKTKMVKDAQFRVASMSKMFTAVAILQLQEKELLRLDDRVSTFLPWFGGKKEKIDLTNVTIRQLLAHQAGLFRDGIAKQWITDRFPIDLDSTINSKSIIFENGITLKYSNHGYAVLGALIEKISKQTYSDYVTKNIIEKLELKNTLPDLPEKRPNKLVNGYTRYLPDNPKQTKESDIFTYAYASATGFISDVKDLAVFLASLHIESKKSLLSRESRKTMMQVHGITDKEAMYGLGLSLDKDSGQLTYGHSGGFAGYTTNAIADPENNIQVIVLTNTNSNTAWVVSNNVMRLIHKLKSMEDIKYIAAEPYSGTFRSRWGDVTVVALGENLCDFSADTPNPVKMWSIMESKKKHVFKNTDKSGFGYPGEEVRFVKIKDGKAVEMISDGMIWSRII